MLKYLSKMERTRSLIIVGFAILMAVSLVVFYAPGRNSAGVSSAGTEVLATVGSDDITVGDVTNSLTNQGGDPSMLNRQIAELLLKQIIQRRVIVQEAKRLGLTGSDAEVAARIREANKDASGKVDVQRYMDRIGDVTRFEEGVRDQISIEKLRAFATAGVTLSEEELQSEFQRQNTSFGLVYVPIVVDKLAAKINATDQELSAYYEQHKTDYRILEAQKKIRYLFIDQNKLGEKIQIPENELHAEYDKLTPENKQAGVKVQQIVLKIARPDLETIVQDKATKLVAQARDEMGNIKEEKFAELAKGNSEDPATAKSGGYLARPVRKSPISNKPEPNPPPQKMLEMELQKLPDLPEGTVTGPVKIGSAYYIFRRGVAVPKTFEDARQELLVSLRNRKAYAVTAELASRATTRLKETKDVQRVAQELAAEANLSPAEMVRETPYIVPGDDVPNIGSSQQFEEGIKPLENPNDVGDRTPIKNGFAIPMLVDKKEPNRIPDFMEVKDKVLQAFRQERAKSQLEETARNLANSAGSAGDLKAAAEKLGLEAKTADAYKLGSPLGDLDTSAASEEAIYALKEGEVTKTPIKIGDNWVVIGITKRTEADLAEFAKQRDTLMRSALEERRGQIFQDYILAAQNRMESEGKIKIYDTVLAKLGENEPTVTNPQRPQLPTSSRPIQIPGK